MRSIPSFFFSFLTESTTTAKESCGKKEAPYSSQPYWLSKSVNSKKADHKNKLVTIWAVSCFWKMGSKVINSSGLLISIRRAAELPLYWAVQGYGRTCVHLTRPSLIFPHHADNHMLQNTICSCSKSKAWMLISLFLK